MEVDYSNASVADIVNSNFGAARIFEKHGIDFCCGGHVSFVEACKDANISPRELADSINSIQPGSDPAYSDFAQWPTDLLCDYLEKKHHRYVRTAGPRLESILQTLCDVHGAEAPWLYTALSSFQVSMSALETHMEQEETQLFAPLRNITNDPIELKREVTISDRILKFISEHESEGSRFKELSAMTKGYVAPEWGCTTFKLGMSLLKEFESDLHLHVHIENNILFPRLLSEFTPTTLD